MSLQGRGTLEINPSKSPFYQTTSQSHGIDPYANSPEWNYNQTYNNQSQTNNQIQKYNRKKNSDEIDVKMMSFLYTRESDRIGSKPNSSTIMNVKAQMEADMRNRQQIMEEEEEGEEEDRIQYEEMMMRSQQKPGYSAEDVLKAYKHVPKSEHPLYVTSGNDYGRKPPDIATIVTDRVPKKQEFSKSFGALKPRNSSMNTALTKSTIHSSLDPQFM